MLLVGDVEKVQTDAEAINSPKVSQREVSSDQLPEYGWSMESLKGKFFHSKLEATGGGERKDRG